MGLQQALARQIGGVMPVMGNCATSAGGAGSVAIFNGDPQSVRFVSSYSLAEGARGYPRLVEYQVAPDPNGGVRLLMNERIYSGPAISVPLCSTGFSFPSKSRRNRSKWPETWPIAGWCTANRFRIRPREASGCRCGTGPICRVWCGLRWPLSTRIRPAFRS